MYRIPSLYQMNMDFDTAKALFNGYLLKGMEMISEHWDRYVSGQCADMYEDDDDFYSTWEYEVNAYNTVYAAMKPLFVA